jgi:hypothetical protein
MDMLLIAGHITQVHRLLRRIERQPRETGKGRTAMRFGKSGQSGGTADAHRPPQCRLGVVGNRFQFRPAAGEHDLAPDWTGKTQILQRTTDFTDQMIQPLPDNCNQLCPGDPSLFIRIFDRLLEIETDDIMIVARTGRGGAVETFYPLRLRAP